MKTIYLLLLLHLGATGTLLSQTSAWYARGPGGGGALFSPAINPANENEIYVACDMGEVFHSTDFGGHYTFVNNNELTGGALAKVRFTSNPSLRYTIDYSEIAFNETPRPVKTTDGGITWTTLAGNPDPDEACLSIWADYNNPDRVVMSQWGTIFFSSNGGATFTPLQYR